MSHSINNTPGPKSLHDLPNELLVKVLKSAPNMSTVYSLVNASAAISTAFDGQALEIVNTILDFTIPSQTRSLMRAVVSIRSGSFSLDSKKYHPYFALSIDGFRFEEKLVAIELGLLRRFVALSHKIHVLSHLCLDQCLQRCRDSLILSLDPKSQVEGENRWRVGLGPPSWTEEQRMILSFWRIQLLNELKAGNGKGLLTWHSKPLPSLVRTNIETFSHNVCQNITAKKFIEDLDPRQQHSTPERAYPRYPFSSNCPAPACQLPEPPAEAKWNFSWICQDAPCPEALEQDVLRQPPPRIWSRTSRSTSSSDSSEELYSSEEEGGEERDVILGTFNQPLCLKDYGLNPPGHEWRQLDQEPIGWQFFLSMRNNSVAGLARFYTFDPWSKFGFAIWEEQRMIDLGLWSHEAMVDASSYYQRWYSLLKESDDGYRLKRRDSSSSIEDSDSDSYRKFRRCSLRSDSP